MRRLDLVAAITAGAATLLAPWAAHAHFVLTAPPAYSVQDGLGSPQKSAPCGQADPGAAVVPTNMVGTFHAGETITITINETVTHPGHYRVALAPTQAELPADPVVTAGSSACGSAAVQSPAVFPVLADGMLEHTSAFGSPQSFTVTLPANMTCTKCTLQVAEFMSNHGLNNPGGCFYHHCADISILPAATTTDAGTDAGTDASTTAPDDSSGCGCALGSHGGAAGDAVTGVGLALALLALAARRRNRNRD